MNLGWQDLVALGIVLAAVLYLSRLALSAFAGKKGSGCASGCGSCSAQSSSVLSSRVIAPEQVVSIGTLGSTSGKRNLQHVKLE
jgi:hypothetical protein